MPPDCSLHFLGKTIIAAAALSCHSAIVTQCTIELLNATLNDEKMTSGFHVDNSAPDT